MTIGFDAAFTCPVPTVGDGIMSGWDDWVLGAATGGGYNAAKAAVGAASGSGGLGGQASQIQNPDQNAFQYGGSAGYADEERKRLANDQAYADNRRAPGINWTNYNQQYDQGQQDRGTALADRGSQQQVFSGLQNYASQGPNYGLARAMMDSGVQAGAQNAQNLVANAGSGMAAMGLRAALQANAGSSLGAAQQGGVLAQQAYNDWRGQQLGAYGQMGGLAGAMRAQDYQGQGLSQAGQAQDTARQQLYTQNELAQRGLNDARRSTDLQGQLAVNQGQAQGNQAYQSLNQQAQEFNASQDTAQRGQNMQLLGGTLQGAASFLPLLLLPVLLQRPPRPPFALCAWEGPRGSRQSVRSTPSLAACLRAAATGAASGGGRRARHHWQRRKAVLDWGAPGCLR